jgi:hypothetical protein
VPANFGENPFHAFGRKEKARFYYYSYSYSSSSSSSSCPPCLRAGFLASDLGAG